MYLFLFFLQLLELLYRDQLFHHTNQILKNNKQFDTHNHIYSFVNTQDEEKIRPSRLHGFFEREIHHNNQSTVTFQCFLQKKFSNVTVMIPLMTAVKFCDLLR